MASHAAVLHTMVGELREDLQTLVAAQGGRGPADAAKVRLGDIMEMAGRTAPVMQAADHVAEAVDRVLDVQAQARQAGAPSGDEQSSQAVNLLEDPLAALSAAVHRLP